MNNLLKQIIKKSPINYFMKTNRMQSFLRKKAQKRKLKEWENNGRPNPPPHIIKQKVLKKYAEQYDLKIFVETGTYLGDMVEAMKNCFDTIYSIELSQEFFQKAKVRFKSDKHIKIIQGDSGIELENIMTNINQPALFWLDGHYSAGVTAKGQSDTPIYKELEHILGAQDGAHVILIDDARCFGTDPEYPTVTELKEFIYSKREDYKITVCDDSFRIEPVVKPDR